MPTPSVPLMYQVPFISSVLHPKFTHQNSCCNRPSPELKLAMRKSLILSTPETDMLIGSASLIVPGHRQFHPVSRRSPPPFFPLYVSMPQMLDYMITIVYSYILVVRLYSHQYACFEGVLFFGSSDQCIACSYMLFLFRRTISFPALLLGSLTLIVENRFRSGSILGHTYTCFSHHCVILTLPTRI
ncbi:hypothetical protein GYMLUDRAFT_777305 [Collybiopsis luxurians FD-317 M1]|uniref:Uncharacterized protein n=1 Tax=Collybiopsis luxurians FD-317 M1 TaxID=944289 RepID=A0A0D0C3L3_9AGAR|nr:hypothetical protein GYMLUDRAFT_777305 [Collybiopsis luxurians FD-317 M1]